MLSETFFWSNSPSLALQNVTNRSRFRYLRSLLRYSLRSLLVLILIVAALCAWLGKHIMRASGQRPIVAEIVAAGGIVGYDYQIHPEFNILDESRTATGSKLVRSVLGDDIYATVIAVILTTRRLRMPTLSICTNSPVCMTFP